MEWVEVRLTVPGGLLDAVEEALSGAGAGAVTVAEGDDQPNFDPGKVWEINLVSAWFAAEALPADLEDRVEAAVGQRLALERIPVEGQDWAHAWKDRFGAFPVGERLWVRPSWVEETAPEGRVELILDPGMAFGTGQHETTRLCLEWLDARVGPGAMVLDYGCGSGILAIAAAKLGAAQVLAVDNDPLAVEATGNNAALNGAADRIAAAPVSPGLDGAGPFPRVVANILSRTLVELADELVAVTASGGELSLSGILAPQAAEVRAAFPAIRWTREARQGDWVRLDGIREA
ncbi:50S ribosomal protein L11 methyltransferase [Thiohalorhabdus methylotrophus]|uniref:Ribosomal protein L11 methyltransferase n=1 Tax=Thiohalorhabdus methylotrophus TaxID=3242694 RepID=A0ABV4TS08_9GAMM